MLQTFCSHALEQPRGTHLRSRSTHHLDSKAAVSAVSECCEGQTTICTAQVLLQYQTLPSLGCSFKSSSLNLHDGFKGSSTFSSTRHLRGQTHVLSPLSAFLSLSSLSCSALSATLSFSNCVHSSCSHRNYQHIQLSSTSSSPCCLLDSRGPVKPDTFFLSPTSIV